MNTIVNDTGFHPTRIAQTKTAFLDIAPDAHDHSNSGYLATIIATVNPEQIIRIAFENFADGRGFTIARQIRLLGFTGHLRATGHVLADQYAMIRRAGFDDVEISQALAARQPWEQWQFRANWQAHDYQSRLRSA